MFQTLLIAFREGLEALLVVVIAWLYLRKTGRVALLGAIRSGLLLALGLSAGLGVAVAVAVAVAVLWCVVHMHRAGRTMGREITRGLDRASLLDGPRAWWAVFAFTVFMVGREGIETATMLASLAAMAEARHMAVGGVLGLLMAAGVAWAWVRHGQGVNLGRFFRVTA